MAEAVEPAGEGARPGRTYVRWSDDVAERLCARLEAGEMLYRICRDADMPTPEGVMKWRKERPDFGARLDAARRAGGRPPGERGPVSTYSPGVAEEIFERVCEGESLTRIGEDPTMPCVWTIFRWRRTNAEFEELMQLGMRIRGERACDMGWDLAMEATPETAYVTHVRLGHLRWMAGVMAPQTYRQKPVEAPKPPERRTILLRHFRVEEDPETGKMEVVAYCPNPYTGEVECEDAPGWRRPAGDDIVMLPGGG